MLCPPHKQAICYRRLPPSPCLSPPHTHHNHHLITSNSNFLSTNNFSETLIKCNKDQIDRRSCRYSSRGGYRSMISFGEEDEDEEEESSIRVSDRFEEAVKLFNERDYYACHDLLESLWYDSHEPLRTLLHALLQCSVAFYHLFNQNHKGAMMELGEGLCKLRKLDFKEGPFYQFEQEITVVLNFIYQTQLELAACNEDFCLAMEQTERSYQLLQGYGAGQRLYFIEKSNNDGNKDDNAAYIVFDPQTTYGGTGVPQTRVKLPALQATQNHLIACKYS